MQSSHPHKATLNYGKNKGNQDDKANDDEEYASDSPTEDDLVSGVIKISYYPIFICHYFHHDKSD